MPNNIDFLIKVVRHRGFAKEQSTTAFFSQYMAEILTSLNPPPLATLPAHSLFGTVCYLQSLRKEIRGSVWDGEGEFSNWRSGHRSVRRTLKLKDAQEVVEILADANTSGKYRLSPANQGSHHGAQSANMHKLCELRSIKVVQDTISDRNVHCKVLEGIIDVGGVLASGTSSVITNADGSVVVDVWLNGQVGDAPTHYQFSIQNPAEGSRSATVSSNPVLLSPMPGKIVKILVADGAEVKQGDAVIILEAMKMEHIVHAPTSG
jgi:acetyl/propionyl-CoA carboxylase alpha subunit